MDVDVPEIALFPPGDAAPAGWLVAALGIVVSVAICRLVLRRLRCGMPVVRPRLHPAASWNGFEVGIAAAVYLWLQLAAAAALPEDATLRARLAAGVGAMLTATMASVVLLRTRNADWPMLGFGPLRPRDDLALGVGAVMLLVTPLLLVAAALDAIVPYRHPLVDFLATNRDLGAIALVVLAAVVAAPVTEEFFFRRVLQGWLERLDPPWGGGGAIGLSALAFALAHVGHGLAWIPLFFFGVVAGYLVRQTGSLVPGIIMHALFNAVSVMLVIAQTGPGG